MKVALLLAVWTSIEGKEPFEIGSDSFCGPCVDQVMEMIRTERLITLYLLSTTTRISHRAILARIH